MKKVLILFLGVISISSCTKDSLTPNAVNQAVLKTATAPNAVKSALKQSFPNATNTSWTQVSAKALQASFTSNSTNQMATFTTQGQMMYSHTVVATSNLPVAIKNYLDTNYKGYVIIKAGSKTNNSTVVTGYVVEFLLNGLVYEIRFDALGNFLSLETENDGDVHLAIVQADLPVSISNYLTANYLGFVFVSAFAEKNGTMIKEYFVNFTLNGVASSLEFDANGNIESKTGKDDHDGDNNYKSAILQTALPAVITNYLTANYIGYVFVSVLVEKNGTIVKEYEVNFNHDGLAHSLEFDANGNIESKNDKNQTAILQSALPSEISNYLTANFKGFVFVSAFKEMKGAVLKKYEVNITQNGIAYHVDFNGNGVYIKD